MMNLLTTKEAAKILRLHPKTLEKWRTRGCGPKCCKIQSDKPGRTYVYRYRREDLKAFVLGSRDEAS